MSLSVRPEPGVKSMERPTRQFRKLLGRVHYVKLLQQTCWLAVRASEFVPDQFPSLVDMEVLAKNVEGMIAPVRWNNASSTKDTGERP